MQALHVVSVVDEKGVYRPCTGRSTFRKTDRRYSGLTPGDIVVMYHCTDPKKEKTAVASEVLRVKSVATGALSVMIKAHSKSDHMGLKRGELKALLAKFYDGAKDDDQFTVIYFD